MSRRSRNASPSSQSDHDDDEIRPHGVADPSPQHRRRRIHDTDDDDANAASEHVPAAVQASDVVVIATSSEESHNDMWLRPRSRPGTPAQVLTPAQSRPTPPRQTAPQQTPRRSSRNTDRTATRIAPSHHQQQRSRFEPEAEESSDASNHTSECAESDTDAGDM
jgi:hypothetical protein